MPFLRKKHTPGSAAGGLVWDDESSVVEVSAKVAVELLRIGDEFSEVLPSDPAHPDYEPEPEPEQLEPELEPEDELEPEADTGDELDPAADTAEQLEPPAEAEQPVEETPAARGRRGR